MSHRCMSACRIGSIAILASLTSWCVLAAEPQAMRLWVDAQPVPKAADIPLLDGVDFHLIKPWQPEADGYKWLHGVNLAWHKGKLYASFGHNRGAENTASEEARYRVSDDGGTTWSDVRTIDTGEEAPDLAVSHGVFVSHSGVLWAFHGAFYGRMGRIHTRAYSLDEATGTWRPRGVVIDDGFWPMNQPVKMDDGNWIMPGLTAGAYSNKTANPPAVAISHGDDLLHWDLVVIPFPEGMKMWGESAIIVEGPEVRNIARYGPRSVALAARSGDFGRTWPAPLAETNLPMATSKPCAGVLSSGQRYLICTTTADTGGRRAPLTIALSRHGEKRFSRVVAIRRLTPPEGTAVPLPQGYLSYPCAVEHQGKLYVGYSNTGGRRGNQNSAELAIIPLEQLRSQP